MTLKRWHWAVIIVTTIGLIVMAPSDDDGSAKKSARIERVGSSTVPSSGAVSDKSSARGAGRVELELLSKLERKQQERSKVSDVFNQTSWYVPPPPVPHAAKLAEPVTPPPPPVASAPLLPFSYLGRYGDGDTKTVILVKGEKVYPVKVGDVIDGTYRVEKIALGTVSLTYLPLNVLQQMRTGELP